MDILASLKVALGKTSPKWRSLPLWGAMIVCSLLVGGLMFSSGWLSPQVASAGAAEGASVAKSGNYGNLTRFHMRF
jgi:CHASE2 domain-containing sensor protein